MRAPTDSTKKQSHAKLPGLPVLSIAHGLPGFVEVPGELRLFAGCGILVQNSLCDSAIYLLHCAFHDRGLVLVSSVHGKLRFFNRGAKIGASVLILSSLDGNDFDSLFR
jgi:hypothetical protein